MHPLAPLPVVPLEAIDERWLAGLNGLEQPRRALAATDAHRDYAELLTATLQFPKQRSDHSRAGHTERVADRDAPAVDVVDFIIDAKSVATVDTL